MRITAIGHAGLLIETNRWSILCDPWFVPAFFGSWFPFPRNDRLSDDLRARIERPDFLYISHLHADHFDKAFLADHVDRGATVLLPDFATGELEAELKQLGFTSFVRTVVGVPLNLDGLEVMILTETSLSDGPGGDSAIVVADSTARIVNQNDCRPHNLEAIKRLGPVDVHFLQYSGAIWYPVVYEDEPERKQEQGRAKRQSQFDRALRYVTAVGAHTVVPSAGPPCFLDPELAWLNDVDGDDSNIFPDATVFLRALSDEGHTGGVLAVPGTVIEVEGDVVRVDQPRDDKALSQLFTAKRDELATYAADWAEWLAAEQASWSKPAADLVEQLARWWEPMLAEAPHLRAAIGANALLALGTVDVLIDFPAGEVRPWRGEPYAFRFTIDARLVQTCIDRRAVDWSNALFLSLRFRAWRAGDFNEYVYNFFKSLSPERMARAEGQARRDDERRAANEPVDEIELDGWIMERWCPHNHADLAEFGTVTDGVLTCAMHGWRFDLATGRCLNSDRRSLRVRPAAS
ncbi:MAG: MBL fold metallo-hydrolase [Acidimicrobiales bacterium]